jgi:hypothetical protein
MPYPDSGSDTITVNTNKKKKKRKLQNQYALISDEEDDDSTAASTDSSTTSLSVSILHKTTSTNKKKSKKKTTFTSNCNHEQEEWLSMKKDPLRAASFLSHPPTRWRNIYERRANEKQATRERNRGVDNVTYGASLSEARNKNLVPPLSNSPNISKPLKPTKQKTQSTLFPFVKKTKTKATPHQHRQLFATDSKSNEEDSLWLHAPDTTHTTPAPETAENVQNTLNSDKPNTTKKEEKPSLPPPATQQNCTGNTAARPTTGTDVTTPTTNPSHPTPHASDITTNTNRHAHERSPTPPSPTYHSPTHLRHVATNHDQHYPPTGASPDTLDKPLMHHYPHAEQETYSQPHNNQRAHTEHHTYRK